MKDKLGDRDVAVPEEESGEAGPLYAFGGDAVEAVLVELLQRFPDAQAVLDSGASASAALGAIARRAGMRDAAQMAGALDASPHALAVVAGELMRDAGPAALLLALRHARSVAGGHVGHV